MKNNLPGKNISKSRPSFNNVNWERLEGKISKELDSSTKDIIFFSQSDKNVLECEKALNSKFLRFYNFSNFRDALNVGFYQFADIIILDDESSLVSHKNFSKLIQKRTSRSIEIIIWDQSSIKELTHSISESLTRITRKNTQELLVTEMRERIISKSDSSSKKTEMNEKEFREFLTKELSEIPSSTPDIILKEAIKVIKNLD